MVPIVCVAGGSGMSSIKALLEHAANVGCARDVVFLFGARAQRDLYCLDEMESLSARWHPQHSMRFLPILSDEPEDSDWAGLRGMVTEQIALQELDWSKAQGYLCGPPGMIDAPSKCCTARAWVTMPSISTSFSTPAAFPAGVIDAARSTHQESNPESSNEQPDCAFRS